MGLAEYIKAGGSLKRELVTLQTDATGSGSINLGSAYVLLNITTDAPCRLRLYDNVTSRDNAAEKIRTFGNTNISASTALIGDFSMSIANNYSIDPVVYGAVAEPTTKLTYYKIDNASGPPYPKITFNRYLLENADVSIANRITLPVIQSSLTSGQITSGTLASITIPQTYLLLSASVSGSSTRARVRLYSTSASLYNSSEVTRPFISESSANSYLIVDAVLSGSETTYFVPKIIGANLRNMGTDLSITRTSRSRIVGERELYYILENVSSTPGAASITASLHIFSLED
jgi:hypothetical protein